MGLIKLVYDRYRGPETPEWAIYKPRLKRYIEYLFAEDEEENSG